MDVLVDRDQLLAMTRHYGSEELKQGWVFLCVGLSAALAGAWLWRSQSAFRHALWPLLLLAAVQMAMGGMTLLRQPPAGRRSEAALVSNPPAFKAGETRRLTRLMDKLRFHKLAWIAGVLAALGLALFLSHNAVARGLALGLLLQSTLMLAANLVAEQRTEAYLDLLRRL
jgi:hypothetical protein